jgi:hypothetical protein
MFALPAAGLGLGTIVGHSFGHSASLTTTNTCGLNINCLPQVSAIPDTKLRDTAIGGGVGLAVGGTAAFVLMLNSHHFYLDQGSPVEMILQQPLTIDVDQLADAAQHGTGNSAQASIERIGLPPSIRVAKSAIRRCRPSLPMPAIPWPPLSATRRDLHQSWWPRTQLRR